MGKTTKVILDTNVLVSALGWPGNPHKVFQKVIAKEAELFISYGQFEELARVLDYPKFNFTEDEKARFKGLISTIAVFVTPRTKLDIVKEDSSDNRILECALVAYEQCAPSPSSVSQMSKPAAGGISTCWAAAGLTAAGTMSNS